MQRGEIIARLRKDHDSFISYIGGLSDRQFLHAAPQKWTAGQQLQHIYLAVRPVVLAFGLPKFMLRLLFGKANRQSRTYDELVARYHDRLENGGKASRPFIPRPVKFNERTRIVKGLKEKTDILCTRIANFTEEELDTLLLPHPLLRKITIREMLYFTIYHVGHHRAAIERSFSALNV